MERRHVLMFDCRGYARIIEASHEEVFIDSMFVKKAHRRRGIGTELLRFTISHLGKHPELDIRWQSLVAQHIATKFGYVREGISDRYENCHIWRHHGAPGNLDRSSFRVQSSRTYKSASRETLVHYLRLDNGARYPLQQAPIAQNATLRLIG